MANWLQWQIQTFVITRVTDRTLKLWIVYQVNPKACREGVYHCWLFGTLTRPFPEIRNNTQLEMISLLCIKEWIYLNIKIGQDDWRVSDTTAFISESKALILWLTHSNNNHMYRITHILECLRLTRLWPHSKNSAQHASAWGIFTIPQQTCPRVFYTRLQGGLSSCPSWHPPYSFPCRTDGCGEASSSFG